MTDAKYLKWPIVILVLGAIFKSFASAMKVMHWVGADLAIIVSWVIIGIGFVYLLIKIIPRKK